MIFNCECMYTKLYFSQVVSLLTTVLSYTKSFSVWVWACIGLTLFHVHTLLRNEAARCQIFIPTLKSWLTLTFFVWGSVLQLWSKYTYITGIIIGNAKYLLQFIKWDDMQGLYDICLDISVRAKICGFKSH